MANLKILKTRIKSVKSTQKITKAMKMVAASKLRRARLNAEAAAPYAKHMEEMLSTLASSARENVDAPALLIGTGKEDVHLIVVATSDRGLCGAFNSSIVRAVRRHIQELERANKKVKLLILGKKGYEQLKTTDKRKIIDTIEGISKKQAGYTDAEQIAERVIALFEAGEFDVCTVFYNKFHSAISQVVTPQQLIPLDIPTLEHLDMSVNQVNAVYEYEPDEESLLKDLLPRNIAVQVYHALLESAASEQGARMSAMDNATRNAGEMMKDLTLVYNRTRQATITKELIEIISGAEAI